MPVRPIRQGVLAGFPAGNSDSLLHFAVQTDIIIDNSYRTVFHVKAENAAGQRTWVAADVRAGILAVPMEKIGGPSVDISRNH
jgi:hypothetical protein